MGLGLIIGVSAKPKHEALGLASADYFSDDGVLSLRIFFGLASFIGSGRSGKESR